MERRIHSAIFGDLGPVPAAKREPASLGDALKEMGEALAGAPSLEEDPVPAGPEAEYIRDPLEIAAMVAGLVPGTKAAEHEREILFVADHAMRRGGVNTPDQFRAFIERQMVQLEHNGDVDRRSKFADPEPVIKKLVRHLSRTQSIFPEG